jgi:hypothetical protein
MFVSAGADGQVRLWDTVRQSCVRLQASMGAGHTATSDNMPVHALATWPSASSSVVPAKKLRIPRKADLERAALMEASSSASSSSSFSSAADNKPALAAVSAAAASPSSSSIPPFAAAASSFSTVAAAAPASGLHLLAESSEFRPPAMRSRDGTALQFDSLLEHERWSKSPSSSPAAAAGDAVASLSASPVPAAATSHNTTFSVAASEFTDAREYDAAVAAAVAAAATRAAAAAAAANTATTPAAAVPSAVSKDASASTSSSSAAAAASPEVAAAGASAHAPSTSFAADTDACSLRAVRGADSENAPVSSSPSSFLSQLSSLRAEVLAAAATSAASSSSRLPNHSLAERRVLDMIELVESEIERPSAANAAAGATAGSASASPSPVSSSSSSSLSAASLSALLCTLLHDAALLAVSQGALGAALRYATRALAAFEGDAESVEMDLDDDGDDSAESVDRRQRRAAERQLLFDNPQRADGELIDMLPSNLALAALPLHDAAASLSSSEATVALPTVIAAPAALYLPVQLLRFACAVETGEWTMAQSLGRTLLGRVSAHNPQRRRVLDEVNRALCRSPSPTAALPLHSLYAHLLAVWHERVLVASAAQALAKAQQHKEQGNTLFAQAGASGARSASVAQAATADASPAADAATTLSSTSSVFAAAAAQYAAGIAVCRGFEALILSGDDEAQESTCPGRLWFDLAAAQLLPSSVTFFSSLSAMTSHTTSAVSSPLLPAAPFSLLQLQFLRASLHSNFAMAVLKCASDSELRAQRLLPTSASASAPSVPPESSEPQYLLLAQRACEDGLAVMEALSKALGPIRAAVEAAKRAPYAGGRRYNKTATTTEQHDDDDDGSVRNVFVENLALGSSLPSLSACSALTSKLYFRHGCAALDRASASGRNASMDSVADLSFALAVQLQPDGKVRREIEARKQKKARTKAQTLQPYASSAVAI